MNTTERALRAIKAAKLRGLTKSELADRLGRSSSWVAKVVNDLYAEGKITIIGKRGRSNVFVIAHPVPDGKV